jgi:hypothetical protein
MAQATADRITMNTNSPIRTLFTLLAATAGLAWHGAALAAPAPTSIADFGNDWYFGDTNNATGVSGVVYWDVVTDAGSTYFVFSITNTTGDGSRITGFAWDWPVGQALAAGPGNTYSSLGWLFRFGNQKLPGEDSNFDVCTFPSPNCQAGGSGTSVTSTSAFNYSWVKLAGAATSEDFAEIRACLRFVGITTGRGTATSDVACVSDRPEFDVSEPSTLGLLGLGLVAAGFARRRWLA